MKEPKKEYACCPYYYGDIGSFGGDLQPPVKRKHTVIQSLWTKPIKDKERLRDTIYIAALSLAFAHRSGYKVHMHTDSKGAELLKAFGYEKLLTTLDAIPDAVPTELFAAGKFFAMKAEGTLDVLHIDVDVFLKKPGVVDRFFDDMKIDVFCQQDEDYERMCDHVDKIRPMHVLGYPAATRPNWRGSMNTGIIGFHNPVLAAKYMGNYFEALGMYTAEKFKQYKEEDKKACMLFDFILEQVALSHMSLGYNAYVLLPMKDPCYVADRIGYQHLQGGNKWSSDRQKAFKKKLEEVDSKLLMTANRAAWKIMNK